MDDNRGWASGGDAIIATSDGGRTWTIQYKAIISPASGTLSGVGALDALDARYVWAVDDGTLIATSDGGTLWRSVGEPHALVGASQVRFFNLLDGWALVTRYPCSLQGCFEEGSLVTTSDGGLSWHPSTLHGSVITMCWASPTVGWAGGNPQLYSTTDGGATWTAMTLPDFYSAPPEPGTLISEIACSGRMAWVLGSQGAGMGQEFYTIDRTADGGRHWQPVLGGVGSRAALPGIDDYVGPMTDPTTESAYFVGFCPNCGPVETSITVTTDGGATFDRYRVNPTSAKSDLEPEAVAFPDPSHGWIIGSVAPYAQPVAAIYATADGGRTWHLQYDAA